MQRTIFSILWGKFLDTLEQATWQDIFFTIAKVFCWGIISLFLINTPHAVEKLAMGLKWHDFAILKVLAAFSLVFFSKNIFWVAKNMYSSFLESLPTLPKLPIHGPQYMGIPVIELVDYIFTASSYSRNDFCEKFAVARKVFDDLAAGFDKIGVFTRGQNNARILSSEFSRADISNILTRATESGEIRPLIREVKNGFTHKPSMAEIISRSPSPSHGFITRPIHSSNVVAI